MDTWWQSLNLPLQLFYGIGVVAAIVLVLEMLLTFFGLNHHHNGEVAAPLQKGSNEWIFKNAKI